MDSLRIPKGDSLEFHPLLELKEIVFGDSQGISSEVLKGPLLGILKESTFGNLWEFP